LLINIGKFYFTCASVNLALCKKVRKSRYREIAYADNVNKNSSSFILLLVRLVINEFILRIIVTAAFI
jgi:hypothetical protein